jgi:hypothetical protein
MKFLSETMENSTIKPHEPRSSYPDWVNLLAIYSVGK